MATKQVSNKQVIWDTKLVNDAIDKLQDGYILKKVDNPFFEGVIGLRRGGLTFRITDLEYDEYIKCALDIHYFAETYCYVKGEEGQPVKIILRDYQKEILDNFANHRFNILMASRQVGKCIDFNTTVYINDNKRFIPIKIGYIYYKILSKKRKLSFLEKIKTYIYTTISFLEKDYRIDNTSC